MTVKAIGFSIHTLCVCVSVCVCVCVCARAPAQAQTLSCVRLFATLCTVAPQAPLSMEFSREEYWSGFPFPTLENLPDPGIEPMSPAFPALAGRFVYNLCNTWCIPEFFCCFGLAWFGLGL